MPAALLLLDALGPTSAAGWSHAAAALAQLHSRALPAARLIAPHLHRRRITAAELQGVSKGHFAAAVSGALVWLVRGIKEEHIAGEGPRQQVCELLCALSDVLYTALAAPVSGSQQGTRPAATTLSGVIQLDGTGAVLHVLADTAEQLNRHVFERAGAVPLELLVITCQCCALMADLVHGWYGQLAEQQAQAGHLVQGRILIGWCLQSGLICQLAHGVLLVLGMDPAPFQARGSQGLTELEGAVLLAVRLAYKLHFMLNHCSVWYQSVGNTAEEPLKVVGMQGRGSDGTAPAPFLRLTLLVLAISQHFRRAAAQPPGTVRNQPSGSRKDVAVLRAALQQQLTPSCCTQLLQRVAPAYWATVQRVLPSEHRLVATFDQGEGDMCAKRNNGGLRMVLCSTFEYEQAMPPFTELGPQELQLVLECAEIHSAIQGISYWEALQFALSACPYPALVEFNSRHGRTLLTLAERSLEAARTAAGPDDTNGRGGSSISSSSTSDANPATAGAEPLSEALRLAWCLPSCLGGGLRGQRSAQGTDCYEAKRYPADSKWALLDPSTAPRLLRLVEALVRTSTSTDLKDDIGVISVMPSHLPEMQLFYSTPSTARAALSAVTSMTKWLQGRVVVLQLLLDSSHNPSAAAAAMREMVPGSAGRAHADWVNQPSKLWSKTVTLAWRLAEFTLQSLVRPAVLLDPVSYAPAATAPAATTAAASAGRRSRAWVMERALLGSQAGSPAEVEDAVTALGAYKEQVLGNPQLLGSILEQLQQEVATEVRAAAERQAASLARRMGGDALALAAQLQAMQLGTGTASSGARVDRVMANNGAGAATDSTSAAGGVPPVTPGDITVAANALLVACKAAGALQGVPQLLELFKNEIVTHRWPPGERSALQKLENKCDKLSAAVHSIAEWAVLLHPVLVQLLPADQGQVLAGMQGSLVGPVGSSSSSRVAQQEAQRASKGLSAEEVTAVLGALQHMVIPRQPGCSNPRCCCLEGFSEAELKTQVCAGCHGTRYCSAACQRAHWKAGHKEVCKAAQAAAKAATTAGSGLA